MKFNLRMPADLYRRLKQAAAENNRSMNQEIVYRLRQTLEGYTR